MKIRIAETDEQIVACYPVMQALRPHVNADAFLPRVRSQQLSGYQLAYVSHDDEPAAVAGFRIGENLAWGRYLYVDDLVTRPNMRSAGFGGALLNWLADLAARSGCVQLHLDSGLERKDAHRFYQRESMHISSYHFRREIEPAPSPTAP